MATPTLHSFLGASSAKRWLTCTPSARMCQRLSDRFGGQSSPFALEGTRAHLLGEMKIRNAVYHEDGMTPEKLSHMSPEAREAYIGINDFRYTAIREELETETGGPIPKDMEQATEDYKNVVMHKYLTAREHDTSTKLYLETRLDYSNWVPDGFGTGDVTIVSDSLLEICDYKHGLGIQVDAEGNPQLRLYALGAIRAFGHLYDFDQVRMTIIQPRKDNISEETISRDDLLQWARDEVVERAQMAWRGEGEFVPGDHCRFCRGKAICSARVSQSLELFRYGFESPGVLSDEQVADILPFLDTAEAWIKDIRTYAENQALRGQRFKGYKLVRGKRPNRKWTDADEVKAQLLRAGYPADQFEETRLRPVGDVEKVLGKTAFRALVGGLVSQGDGRLTLVPESDKRQEYGSADADFRDLLD